MTAPGASGTPFHTLLLVGFMCSGKTSVGRRVASLLGWDFLDLDDLVEERAGRSVERIFREDGEEGFRRLEAEAAREALGGTRRVLAPGGGWAAAGPDRMESLGPGVLTVWLQVDAETAIERARGEGRVRPLLDVPDRLVRAEELLAQRRPYYRKARLHMDSVGASTERLAEDIVRFLRTGGADA